MTSRGDRSERVDLQPPTVVASLHIMMKADDGGGIDLHGDVMAMLCERERVLRGIQGLCARGEYVAAMDAALATNDLVVVSDFVAGAVLHDPQPFLVGGSLRSFHLPVVSALLRCPYPSLVARGAQLLHVLVCRAEDVLKQRQGSERKAWVAALKALNKTVTDALKTLGTTAAKELQSEKKRLDTLLSTCSAAAGKQQQQ